jgi:hypothetical protein
MANELYSNPYTFRSLPWRKVTPLHRTMGPRCLIVPLVAGISVPISLFNAPYHDGTIDRIIGCELNLGGISSAALFTIQENNSGWARSYHAFSNPGTYCFNIVTLDDSANITLTVNKAVTAAMLCTATLYNFEIPPDVQGHS